ncbi:MAG: electron transport complex subunit RsxC [Clostridia bacterium]|nr:electron transport complex subunit RsxC [Clostridia bacterium]
MFGFLGNTHVPHRKNTARLAAVPLPAPKEVLLSLSQHIGAPAVATVKVGDTVKKGQKIADAGGFVSAPVHASVSGTVTKIEEYLKSDGRTVTAIRIANDFENTISEEVAPPTVTNVDELLAAVTASGLIGLGGAGFPTHVKLAALKNEATDTLVINGSECEPYITSDTRTMLEDGEDIFDAVATLRRVAPSLRRVIFGVEKNKPEAIAKLKSIFAGDDTVTVKKLPSLYPQGAEKVLIANTTGRIVPEGKLPADVGVIVMNVTSLAFLGKYLKSGLPLVEKTITLDGTAVTTPKNLRVPIGTPLSEVVALGGVDPEASVKVLYGGPMMGVAVCSLDEPVLKNTNAVTVLREQDTIPEKATACLHCGRCVSACPHMLTPTLFSKALEIGDKEQRYALLEEKKVALCIECGCCSFVCPAHRPLVQNNRLAKSELRDHKAHIATLQK